MSADALTLFQHEPTHGIGTLRLGQVLVDNDELPRSRMADGWWLPIYQGRLDRLVALRWHVQPDADGYGGMLWHREVGDSGGGGGSDHPRRVLGPLADLERFGATDIVPVPHDVTEKFPAWIAHDKLPADSWRT